MQKFKSSVISLTVLLLLSWTAADIRAQFRMTWVDIGEMQSRYSSIGAHHEGETHNRSLEWPAILRGSGHYRAKAAGLV